MKILPFLITFLIQSYYVPDRDTWNQLWKRPVYIFDTVNERSYDQIFRHLAVYTFKNTWPIVSIATATYTHYEINYLLDASTSWI